MPIFSTHRRRTPLAAVPADFEISRMWTPDEGWVSLDAADGQGGGFHDCPLCRELRSRPEPAPALVGLRRESLPLLARTGWLDDLLELVGPDATVRVMGHEMEAEPVEVISIATFLARLGYE